MTRGIFRIFGTVLLAAALSQAQNQTPPNPGRSAEAIVTSTLAANVSVDGVPQGRVTTDHPLAVRIELGRRSIEAINDQGEKWQHNIEAAVARGIIRVTPAWEADRSLVTAIREKIPSATTYHYSSVNPNLKSIWGYSNRNDWFAVNLDLTACRASYRTRSVLFDKKGKPVVAGSKIDDSTEVTRYLSEEPEASVVKSNADYQEPVYFVAGFQYSSESAANELRDLWNRAFATCRVGSSIGLQLYAPGSSVLQSQGADHGIWGMAIAGGPAQKAGLNPTWEIITDIDGKPINSGKDLIDIVEQKPVGSTVELSIVRSNQASKLTVPVGDRAVIYANTKR